MALPRSGIPVADPAPQDATVDDLTAATLTVTGASTLAAVTATSVAAPHSGLTGVTADQHHAQSHGHTGADGSGTVAHSATTGKTANDHHNQVHAVDGADHTATGLTAGHVLRATGATTFAFGALADSDVPATIARDTEVATAVDDHAALADPHTGYQKESEKAVANGYASLDASAMVPVTQIRSVNAGTSFPVSPTTNDQFFRTDRGLLYYWDGTRWLTVQVYKKSLIPKTLPDYTANGTFLYAVAEDATNFWVTDAVILSRISTAGDASNYWTFDLQSIDNTGGGVVATLATRNTQADSTVFHDNRVTIGALFGTAATWMILKGTKTGAPGNIQWLTCEVNYRLVG